MAEQSARRVGQGAERSGSAWLCLSTQPKLTRRHVQRPKKLKKKPGYFIYPYVLGPKEKNGGEKREKGEQATTHSQNKWLDGFVVDKAKVRTNRTVTESVTFNWSGIENKA